MHGGPLHPSRGEAGIASAPVGWLSEPRRSPGQHPGLIRMTGVVSVRSGKAPGRSRDHGARDGANGHRVPPLRRRSPVMCFSVRAAPRCRSTHRAGKQPPEVDPLTRWDRAYRRLAPGDDVISTSGLPRTWTRATSWGHTRSASRHWDSQYRSARYGYDGPPDRASLMDSIVTSIDEVLGKGGTLADRVCHLAAPLGIGHGDHRDATRAALICVQRSEGVDLVLYEDLPYAAERPRMRNKAIHAIEEAGFSLEPLPLEMPGASTRAASLAVTHRRSGRSEANGSGRHSTPKRGIGESPSTEDVLHAPSSHGGGRARRHVCEHPEPRVQRADASIGDAERLLRAQCGVVPVRRFLRRRRRHPVG